jgi:hypothetical protein
VTEEPALLVDVGSTVIKICTRSAQGHLSPVERVGRLPGVAPGSQARALIEQRKRATGISAVRVCSSANGGLRVGILGLSRRHSIAAAARSVTSAGANVVYSRLLANDVAEPAIPVDVLVLTGGVDGAELGLLRKALRATRVADYPRDVLVWAGADAPDIVAGLPVDRTAANVIDTRLRPYLHGLADTIRDIYLRDLIDHKGLRDLADVTDVRIWPTPAVVGLAAARMTRHRMPPGATSPFVVVDTGGSTTDVFTCAELCRERSAPGESIVRRIFTDLGTADSRPGLLQQLTSEPDLFDIVSAVAPGRSRSLYTAICEGDASALAPPAGFLVCLFLALRRLTRPGAPHAGEGADLARAASFVITGGAWDGTEVSSIHRVIGAACGTPGFTGSVLVDRDYQLWAHGIQEVPKKED